MTEPDSPFRKAPPAAAQSLGSPGLAALVAEHHAELYRYAYRLCGSPADAEDLVQQTYLTAQTALAKGTKVEHPRAWLFTILRTVYLKSKRRSRPSSASDLDLNHEELAFEPAPADEEICVVVGDDEVDSQQVQLALNELPDEFKLVLLMFYFEHCSYAEIARRLELPPGTVMSRLSRAKQLLRNRMCAAAPPSPVVPRPRLLTPSPLSALDSTSHG